MLINLAWRNIWRNKRRSLVVLSSIIVGIISILFMDGLNTGALYQMLYNSISTSVAHVQVHKQGFNDNKVIQSTIDKPENVEALIDTLSGIKYYSKKVLSLGLISSASNSSGVFISGVSPNSEQNITKIKSSITEGAYFGDEKKQIVIGKKLAEKLDVIIGDKVILLANTPDGSIGSDAFRVSGIYKTENSGFDKSAIYIRIKDAQHMLSLGNQFHEFALILNDYRQAGFVKDILENQLDDSYEVYTYKELLPFVIIQMDMYKESMYIVNLIIGLALIFGIINAMLMSVYERIHEIGVLMSIGMRNVKIFNMIIFEALILGVLGTIVGVILGYFLVLFFSNTGIDFSLFAESLNSFGMGAVLYPHLEFENVVSTLFIIPFITILGAVYPAIKAVKLNPVNAIKYV